MKKAVIPELLLTVLILTCSCSGRDAPSKAQEISESVPEISSAASTFIDESSQSVSPAASSLLENSSSQQSVSGAASAVADPDEDAGYPARQPGAPVSQAFSSLPASSAAANSKETFSAGGIQIQGSDAAYFSDAAGSLSPVLLEAGDKFLGWTVLEISSRRSGSVGALFSGEQRVSGSVEFDAAFYNNYRIYLDSGYKKAFPRPIDPNNPQINTEPFFLLVDNSDELIKWLGGEKKPDFGRQSLVLDRYYIMQEDDIEVCSVRVKALA
ncbi:MAG: hypothetical protein LBC56_08095 [Oscillospiraceae bacterium]|jgi:hypothetical protein|nr:hypothetical protein [Oscillospiraceae bacterium]